MSEWGENVAREAWDVFPDCVVVIDGEYLGTKADQDSLVDYAFEAGEDGRLSDDPALVALRIANSLEITLEKEDK
jgi:hypothetical protein